MRQIRTRLELYRPRTRTQWVAAAGVSLTISAILIALLPSLRVLLEHWRMSILLGAGLMLWGGRKLVEQHRLGQHIHLVLERHEGGRSFEQLRKEVESSQLLELKLWLARELRQGVIREEGGVYRLVTSENGDE